MAEETPPAGGEEQRRRRGPSPGLCVVLAVYAAAAAWFLPRLDVPFNDDWCYSWIAKQFIETGRFVSTGLESTPVTLQSVLAAPVCAAAGSFSFVALHVSTALIGLAGLTAFHAFLKSLGFDEVRATCGTLALLLNPVCLLNSFTFMTDVPGLSFALVALLLFTKGVRERRDLLAAAGVAVAVAGAFVRLFDVVLVATFAGWTLLDPEARSRLTFRRAALLLAPVAAGAALMAAWMTIGRTYAMTNSAGLREKAVTYGGAALTLGFLTIPLSLPPLLRREHELRGPGRATFGVAACAVAAAALAVHLRFPFLTNQISLWGMYEPGEYLFGERPRLLSVPLRAVVSVLSVVSASALAAHAVREIRAAAASSGGTGVAVRLRGRLASPRTLLHTFSLLYLAALFRVTHLFDRYVLLLLPSAIVLALDLSLRVRFPTAWTGAALAAMGAFSFVHGTDAAAWNAIVWHEAGALVRQGVPARTIEAGVGWSGWSILDTPPLPPSDADPPKPLMAYHGWAKGCTDTYLFSFSRRVAGFHLLKEFPWRSFPFLPDRSVYLLERKP
jgi:hypothetical protein